MKVMKRRTNEIRCNNAYINPKLLEMISGTKIGLRTKVCIHLNNLWFKILKIF